MLIQSGAMIPDEDMVESMEKFYTVSVFTGFPEANKKDNASYAGAIRFAAAKGGIGKIVVYWGVLESGTRDLVTKTLTWLPLIGRSVPDEAQEMRIRLKVAVIDVATGQWQLFSPQAFKDGAISAKRSREHSDQAQVASLKSQAYRAAADGILARYGQ